MTWGNWYSTPGNPLHDEQVEAIERGGVDPNLDVEGGAKHRLVHVADRELIQAAHAAQRERAHQNVALETCSPGRSFRGRGWAPRARPRSQTR